MQRFARLALIALMLAACVGCDQTSKALVRDHLQGRGTMSFLDDTLRLQYVENPGAFLSLGESLPHRLRTALFTNFADVALMAGIALLILEQRRTERPRDPGRPA